MEGQSTSILLSGAFNAAFAGREELHARWIKVSAQLGSRLQRSALMMTIQRIGQIALLLRALESEKKSQVPESDRDIMGFHYQHMMSEVWVLLAYEAARTVRQRKIGQATPSSDDVFRRLEIVRMVIAKHEIASDKGLATPLTMESHPPKPDDRPVFYDRTDPLRAQITPIGISERGSVGWWAIDVRAKGTRWVERQQLSDDLLEAWSVLPDEQAQSA